MSPTSTEQILARDPTPGHWILVVDPFDLATNTSETDFTTIVTAPEWGSLTIDDAPAVHATGVPWQVSVTATALTVPEGGALGGFVSIESGGITLWGGGQVELRIVG